LYRLKNASLSRLATWTSYGRRRAHVTLLAPSDVLNDEHKENDVDEQIHVLLRPCGKVKPPLHGRNEHKGKCVDDQHEHENRRPNKEWIMNDKPAVKHNSQWQQEHQAKQV